MSQGKTTRIDILRHGLPEGDGCLRGSTDFTITDVGLEQMNQSVSGLDDIEQVVTSPLHRCQYFASTFSARYALPIQNDPQWQELDFGQWDGQDKQALWQEHGEQLTRFWENPWLFTPHGGESLVEFDRRIQQAWQSLIDTYNGKRILLVTHSGVMKQLLRQLLSMPEDATYLQRIDLPYAARYRVTVYTDESGKHWPQLQL
ncbi:histidine phosphatase family protein [Photobacterium sanctipauli]|uniref:Histidine phosphatase family protein n=1 Tax=Photobacterium sanctipauli TaxID=1342794 RepID=A0A2T3NV90_9GAMM|nr:histidine phosphatase family protein [Photobacterium sanctipauli]PSW20138.1 histidine phosphatase family protein [Photobacterium sanctipauli]